VGPDELRRMWDEAGGAAAESPRGHGLLGLRATTDPAALAGAAVAALGVPLNGQAGWPAEVRAASLRYADWLPSIPGGCRAVDYGDVDVVGDDPAVAFMQAHERLADIVAAAATPLVVGGDPLVTLPVLQVLSGKLRGRLGVVAFTPHVEVTPDPPYSASSRWARSLELGVPAPANLVLVGTRTGPQAAVAHTVLERLGAAVFTLDEVERHGARVVAQEALELAAAGTEAVYLSVDVGVVAGLGDPVGLQARELLAGIEVVSSALLAAADICAGRRAAASPGSAALAARAAAAVAAGIARRLS